MRATKIKLKRLPSVYAKSAMCGRRDGLVAHCVLDVTTAGKHEDYTGSRRSELVSHWSLI